uniref:Uncharacterized protein n=1 Tax=Arundo donax TaxID=35708 RepID=A0A0A9AQ45_ARUDO
MYIFGSMFAHWIDRNSSILCPFSFLFQVCQLMVMFFVILVIYSIWTIFFCTIMGYLYDCFLYVSVICVTVTLVR